MAKTKGVTLTDKERAALENAWRQSKSHDYRQRCQMILLKSQLVNGKHLRSQEVASQVGCCQVVVNTWLRRYQQHGLEGLNTKSGQGHQLVLDQETEWLILRLAVQQNRQHVSLTKAELEQQLGKAFSALFPERFLKETVAASNEFDGE